MDNPIDEAMQHQVIRHMRSQHAEFELSILTEHESWSSDDEIERTMAEEEEEEVEREQRRGANYHRRRQKLHRQRRGRRRLSRPRTGTAASIVYYEHREAEEEVEVWTECDGVRDR